MSETSQNKTQGPRLYGGWAIRRSTGVFAGLTFPATVLFLVGMVAAILTMQAVDAFSGLVVAAVTLLLTGLMVARVADQPIAEVATTGVAWLRGRRAKEKSYRSGPLSVIPGGRHLLPGLAARSEAHEAQDSIRRPFGLLAMPAPDNGSLYTTCLRTEPQGEGQMDSDTVDQWVAGYGQWLAALGQDTRIAGASVTVETAPDSGRRLHDEVQRLRSANPPAFAAAVMDETAATYPSETATIRSRAAITWRGRTGPQALQDMAVDIGNAVPSHVAALSRAGGGAVTPMPVAAIAAAVSAAYSPGEAARLETAMRDGHQPLSWDSVGPVAHDERWDRLRHDDGWSVSWVLDEAPRGAVRDRVLRPLMAPNPRLPRKRVTLLYRPYRPGEAADVVDADVNNATTQANQGGRRQLATKSARTQAALKRAEEQQAGAGLVRFSAVITVTVTHEDELRAATKTMEDLASSAHLRIRRCYGAQAAAFTAGLGIGVMLPLHATVPALLSGQ